MQASAAAILALTQALAAQCRVFCGGASAEFSDETGKAVIQGNWTCSLVMGGLCTRLSDRDGVEILESTNASTVSFNTTHFWHRRIGRVLLMPARIQSQASRRLAASFRRSRLPSRCAASMWQTTGAPLPRTYATAATSIGSALRLPADYVPPTKPPSARPPEVRKSQLLRTYTSLLRSTPLILVFQHNNLTATEWAAIRRELNLALASVPAPVAGPDGQSPADIASNIQLQVVRTRMFDIALKIVEFFDPASVTAPAGGMAKKAYNHDLSAAAHDAIKAVEAAAPEDSAYAQLAPLLVGPVALLTFPAVSPQHLAAALSILSPSPPAFPAPTRKKNPGYHDLSVQNGLQKLLLVGGRIEDKIFDLEGVRWVGGIQGGLDGLRAQLVIMLQSAGLGLTTALEGASKSLWLTMESRRSVLEEEQKGPEEKKEPEL